MAEKTFTIKVEGQGFDPVIKKIAQTDLGFEKLQDRLKSTSDDVVGLKQQNQELAKIFESSSIFMKSYSSKASEVYNNLFLQATKVTTAVDKLQTMNQAMLKSLEETNKLSLKKSEIEIEAILKTARSVEQLSKVYENKEELLKEQAAIARARVEHEYKQHIQDAHTTADTIALLEQNKADRIRQINASLNADLAKNAKAQIESTIRNISESVDTAKKHTGGLWENVIDVGATKKHIETVKSDLETYKKTLAASKKVAEDYYTSLENKYGNDISEFSKIHKEKERVLNQFDYQIKQVDVSITETEKKGYDLRLKQVQQYVDNFKNVSTTIKDETEIIGKTIGMAFDARIQELNDEMKNISNRQGEIVEERKAFSSELEELRKKEADTTKTLTAQEADDLMRLSALDKQLVEEDEKLKKEKEKKEKDRAKAEKLKKKGELVIKLGVAVSDVAAGVAKALALGPFIGPVLAAINAAAGAVQIGIISKQLAKFAAGGLLKGKRHMHGGMRIEGTNIEVEGGEYVVNRESTAKNIGLVRYINSQRRTLTSADMNGFFSKSPQVYEPPFRRMFESGGQMPVVNNTVNIDNEVLIDAIKSIKFAPKVAVTDIIRAQDELTRVGGWAGL